MKREPILQLLFSFSCLSFVLGCSLTATRNQNTGSNTNANENSNAVAASNAAPEGSGGDARSADAERHIADLYKQHDAKKSPFFQSTDRARVDAFFTKATADLIWHDSRNSKGEIGAIDFDPLYDAQDLDKKNFAVGPATVKGDSATVVASFTNYGAKKRVTFLMKMQDGSWKVDDIKYDGGHNLVKLLKDAYDNELNNANVTENVSGNFEGTYRVGDTTCTVRPDRQAFEIRWAKGKGSEYFFFKEGGTVFESEPDKTGGRNEFRFDDENYNSGTFHRADGKTLPVSRAR